MSTIFLLYSFLCNLNVFRSHCKMFSHLKTVYKIIDIWILGSFFRMFHVSCFMFLLFPSILTLFFLVHFFLPCHSHFPSESSFLGSSIQLLSHVHGDVGSEGWWWSLGPPSLGSHKSTDLGMPAFSEVARKLLCSLSSFLPPQTVGPRLLVGWGSWGLPPISLSPCSPHMIFSTLWGPGRGRAVQTCNCPAALARTPIRSMGRKPFRLQAWAAFSNLALAVKQLVFCSLSDEWFFFSLMLL